MNTSKLERNFLRFFYYNNYVLLKNIQFILLYTGIYVFYTFYCSIRITTQIFISFQCKIWAVSIHVLCNPCASAETALSIPYFADNFKYTSLALQTIKNVVNVLFVYCIIKPLVTNVTPINKILNFTLISFSTLISRSIWPYIGSKNRPF